MAGWVGKFRCVCMCNVSECGLVGESVRVCNVGVWVGLKNTL